VFFVRDFELFGFVEADAAVWGLEGAGFDEPVGMAFGNLFKGGFGAGDGALEPGVIGAEIVENFDELFVRLEIERGELVGRFGKDREVIDQGAVIRIGLGDRDGASARGRGFRGRGVFLWSSSSWSFLLVELFVCLEWKSGVVVGRGATGGSLTA
jgi:hypothetical protein